MATIKSFTSLEQSKKLAEILPLKSADMCYIQDLLAGGKYGDYKPYIGNLIPAYGQDKIKCWSLAALLGILPDSIYDNTDEYSQLEFSKKSVAYHDINDDIKVGAIKENLVDACYEMILKLKELKLI